MRPTIAQGEARRGCTLTLATFSLAVLAAVCAEAQSAKGPTPSDDPFARRSWQVQIMAHGALEAWNYNISHEELGAIATGMTYGLRDGVVITAAWPIYHVSQRGVDGYLMGATVGVRGRVYQRPRLSIFLEAEIGVSEADTNVPPRGTRFNYLALGGVGATIRLRPALHLLASIKLVHLSNGGVAGRDRNPDIEAIGPSFGILVGF